MRQNRESVQSNQQNRRVIRESKSIAKTESESNGSNQYRKQIPRTKVEVHKTCRTGRTDRTTLEDMTRST